MTAAAISDVWGIRTLRRCTDTIGVQCWGCGRKGWRKGTDPDRRAVARRAVA